MKGRAPPSRGHPPSRILGTVIKFNKDRNFGFIRNSTISSKVRELGGGHCRELCFHVSSVLDPEPPEPPVEATPQAKDDDRLEAEAKAHAETKAAAAQAAEAATKAQDAAAAKAAEQASTIKQLEERLAPDEDEVDPTAGAL